MTETDDFLVRGEFAAFREAYAPAVRPAGPAEVRRTVRRRRRRAVVGATVVVVLAVAIPVGAYAALHERRPPAPAQTVEPAPSPSASAPSASPSPAPGTTGPTPAAPDGRISRPQLLAARVDLPDWPSYAPTTCATVDVRLGAGPNGSGSVLLLGDLGYGDLDGDGAAETVGLVGCPAGEGLAKQLVAFDRDRHRRIVAMGQVVGTRGGMADITDFSVRADGRIRAQVADEQPCCDMPEWWPQRQWRTYGWVGARFVQTAGPTRFGRDPRLTDLVLAAGDLVLDPADASGKRTGSVTVTVTNKGPVDVPSLGFGELFTVGEPAGGDLSGCRTASAGGNEACLLDGLRAGRSRSYTFRFRVDPAERPGSVRVVHYDEQGRWWGDRNPSDNFLTLHVKS